jgi:hypothetical protein
MRARRFEIACAALLIGLPLSAVAMNQRSSGVTWQTVGMEWELHGDADDSRSANYMMVAGLDKDFSSNSKKIIASDVALERLICTNDDLTGPHDYPLVSITYDNALPAAATLEIVTGAVDYNHTEQWDKVFTFIQGFFDAVHAACAAHKVPSETNCYVPIAAVVEAMNRNVKLKGKGLVAVDNMADGHLCGGKEFAKDDIKTRIARMKSKGAPAIATKTTAVAKGLTAKSGYLGNVGTQVSVAIALTDIGQNKLKDLFALPTTQLTVGKGASGEGGVAPHGGGGKTISQQVYEKVMANKADLKRLVEAAGFHFDDKAAGFWALMLYRAEADAIADFTEGATKKDVHNLLLKTPIEAVATALYAADRSKFTDGLANQLGTTFAVQGTGRLYQVLEQLHEVEDGVFTQTSENVRSLTVVDALKNKLKEYFTSFRGGGTIEGAYGKQLALLPGDRVVLEARLGGWTEDANLVKTDGGVGFHNYEAMKNTIANALSPFTHGDFFFALDANHLPNKLVRISAKDIETATIKTLKAEVAKTGSIKAEDIVTFTPRVRKTMDSTGSVPVHLEPEDDKLLDGCSDDAALGACRNFAENLLRRRMLYVMLRK